jgi:hypothetical protein
VTGDVRKKSKRTDTLLAHCLARAVVEEHGGIEKAVATYGPRAEKLGKWGAIKVAVKVTPKASRVAGFIISWAVGMREDGRDEYSITEYQRFWNENERQAYRLQSEFRDLWPEYETPNDVARQVVRFLDARAAAKDVASLATRLEVTA